MTMMRNKHVIMKTSLLAASQHIVLILYLPVVLGQSRVRLHFYFVMKYIYIDFVVIVDILLSAYLSNFHDQLRICHNFIPSY